MVMVRIRFTVWVRTRVTGPLTSSMANCVAAMSPNECMFDNGDGKTAPTRTVCKAHHTHT